MRRVPADRSPASASKCPAKKKIDLKGTYSPKGTRCILSYRAAKTPSGVRNEAELKRSNGFEGVGSELRLMPKLSTMTGALTARASEDMPARKRGSSSAKGAGASGHTTRFVGAGGIASCIDCGGDANAMQVVEESSGIPLQRLCGGWRLSCENESTSCSTDGSGPALSAPTARFSCISVAVAVALG